jgi:hypothetical protein
MTNSAAWQHEHEYVNTTTKVGQLSPAGGRLSVAFLVHIVARVKDRSVDHATASTLPCTARGSDSRFDLVHMEQGHFHKSRESGSDRLGGRFKGRHMCVIVLVRLRIIATMPRRSLLTLKPFLKTHMRTPTALVSRLFLFAMQQVFHQKKKNTLCSEDVQDMRFKFLCGKSKD